jgi:Phosphodiester glycosidase
MRSAAMDVALPLRAPAPSSPRPVRRLRVGLADGAATTVHVATYDARSVDLRVALVHGQQLAGYCAARGVGDAIVGGFFTRPDGEPLGELRTRGIARRHVPFDDPWAAVRACVNVRGGRVTIAPRSELGAAPHGDLLQAGPLLVRDGVPVFDRAADLEGFRAGAHQFDSDITSERHPRAALGMSGDGKLLAVAADGRSRADAGLTLEELAELMVAFGARDALNLDGGGSTTLIAGGRLRNRPRAAVGVPEPGGRAVATALLFLPR